MMLSGNISVRPESHPGIDGLSLGCPRRPGLIAEGDRIDLAARDLHDAVHDWGQSGGSMPRSIGRLADASGTGYPPRQQSWPIQPEIDADA
jgi:hypothetical protein